LRLTGESEAGEALLRDVLARDPGAAEARLNLAADLLQEERAAGALALLDAAPAPAEPRLNRHWRAQRALALLQSGRPAEARPILEAFGAVPPELAPLILWRHVLLALAEGHHAQARELAGLDDEPGELQQMPHFPPVGPAQRQLEDFLLRDRPLIREGAITP
jgi:hypothetical protein